MPITGKLGNQPAGFSVKVSRECIIILTIIHGPPAAHVTNLPVFTGAQPLTEKFLYFSTQWPTNSPA